MYITFDIVPFVGPLPVRFGMLRDEVHALLGSPESSHPIWNKSGTTDYWNASRINVGYHNDGTVKHVGFSPGGYSLLLSGRGIWSSADQPDPNPFLLEHDPAPVEYAGFLIFRAIGVTTTGYHDDDEAQVAVTVSPAGTWDELLSNARPPNLRKYKSG